MSAIVDLAGKRGLVVGIANAASIDQGCAAMFQAAGAELARERTPAHHLVSIEQVEKVAAVLASDAAATLTGSVVFADAGFHVTA